MNLNYSSYLINKNDTLLPILYNCSNAYNNLHLYKLIVLQHKPTVGHNNHYCYENALKEYKISGNPIIIGMTLQFSSEYAVGELYPHAYNYNIKEDIYYDTENVTNRSLQYTWNIIQGESIINYYNNPVDLNILWGKLQITVVYDYIVTRYGKGVDISHLKLKTEYYKTKVEHMEQITEQYHRLLKIDTS